MKIPKITSETKPKIPIDAINSINVIPFSLLLSLVIFGIFILATSYQRRIIAVKNVEDNLRFAVESMAREIRTGKDFTGGGSQLNFTNALGNKVIYRLNSGAVEKSETSSYDEPNYLRITGPETAIDYLTFVLMGQQPRITIAVGATSKVGAQRY